MFWILQLLSLIAIVSLIPLHGVAVSHDTISESTVLATPDDLIWQDNVIYKPNWAYFDGFLIDKAQRLVAKGYKAQCVIGVKKLLDITKPIGKVSNLQPLKEKPQIGDIAVMSLSHIAAVVAIENDTVTVWECNYDYQESCRIESFSIDKFKYYEVREVGIRQ